MQGYETGEACCVGYFGEGNDCSIVDLCAGSSSAAAIATVAPADTTKEATTKAPETTEAVTTTVEPTTTAKATTEPPKTTTDEPTSEETPGSECPEAKWHMSTLPGGAYTCTNDDKYPPVWSQSDHLFNTAQECCDKFFREQCIVKVNCPMVAPTTTTAKPIAEGTGEVPGANCPEDKWHMSTLPGGQNICTNDEVYPAAWNNMTGYLFDSAQACCDKFFGGDCIILDHCDCPKNWHLSTQIGDIQTCTNDREYPDGWNYNPGVLIFPSAEECCETLFGNPDCTKRDICGQKKCLDTWHVNPDDPSSGW